MRLTRLFLALLAGAAILLAGCSKDEDNEGVKINGVTWSKFNVGEPGTFTAAATDYGMFYQWDIKVGWSATDPATGVAIDDWNSGNTGAEGDVWEQANDPCPTGWRLPTKDEQATLLDVDQVTVGDFESMNGVNGRKFTDNTTNKSIFFPAAGYRFYSSGTLLNTSTGYYWSSSPNTPDYAWGLLFDSGSANQYANWRSAGLAVRCVRP